MRWGDDVLADMGSVKVGDKRMMSVDEDVDSREPGSYKGKGVAKIFSRPVCKSVRRLSWKPFLTRHTHQSNYLQDSICAQLYFPKPHLRRPEKSKASAASKGKKQNGKKKKKMQNKPPRTWDASGFQDGYPIAEDSQYIQRNVLSTANPLRSSLSNYAFGSFAPVFHNDVTSALWTMPMPISFTFSYKETTQERGGNGRDVR
jgi:hypothetical protein